MILISESSPAVANMFPFFEKEEEFTFCECSRKCKTISGSDIIYNYLADLFLKINMIATKILAFSQLKISFNF